MKGIVPAGDLLSGAINDPSGRGDRRQDRNRAGVCEIVEASRGQLDLLYEAHAPRVYRMALRRTATEAERVTEAVFLIVLRDLASWTHAGQSLPRAILAAARDELSKVASRTS